MCRRLVILRRQVLPPSIEILAPPSLALPHPIRIFRINPEPMMIAMTRRQEIEGLRAVHRFECAGI
jgi:hypothetical protein